MLCSLGCSAMQATVISVYSSNATTDLRRSGCAAIHQNFSLIPQWISPVSCKKMNISGWVAIRAASHTSYFFHIPELAVGHITRDTPHQPDQNRDYSEKYLSICSFWRNLSMPKTQGQSQKHWSSFPWSLLYFQERSQLTRSSPRPTATTQQGGRELKSPAFQTRALITTAAGIIY